MLTFDATKVLVTDRQREMTQYARDTRTGRLARLARLKRNRPRPRQRPEPNAN